MGICIRGAPRGAIIGLFETASYECRTTARTTSTAVPSAACCTRIETLNAIAGDNVDG